MLYLKQYFNNLNVTSAPSKYVSIASIMMLVQSEPEFNGGPILGNRVKIIQSSLYHCEYK